MRHWLAVLAWVAFVLGAEARQAVPPSPNTFVTDGAGVLSPSTVTDLNRQLAEFERQTSSQVVVWIERKLPARAALDDYVLRLFEAWKIGQKGKDNGVLLAVFVEDRQMRIEVGYGLEGALPDALAGRILDHEIRPRFRSGDFNGGIRAGVTAILAATRGEYRSSGNAPMNRQTSRSVEMGLLVGGTLGFLAGAAVRALVFRSSSALVVVAESILGGFFGAVGHAIAAALFLSTAWWLGFIPLVLAWVFILVRHRGEEWSRSGRRRYFDSPGSGWNWGGGSSSGWSGFGGGGFSGGGGRSGGGGASGGW